MLVGSDSELVVEAVMPDFGHVVPIGDDSVFDGVFECQDSFLGLSLLSNIGIFVVHANHDVLIFGSPNNRGEGSSRSVIT